MRLRRYRTEDLPILARLFGETVRQVNCRDYTLPQVEAWAAGEADLLTRDSWFQRLYTLVAEAGGRIVGYGNVEDTGYLDHLFVRWDCQGQGIGTALYRALLPRLEAQGLVNLYAVLALPNPGSEALHRRFGFTRLGLYPQMGFKLGAWHDVAQYGLRLRPADWCPPDAG